MFNLLKWLSAKKSEKSEKEQDKLKQAGINRKAKGSNFRREIKSSRTKVTYAEQEESFLKFSTQFDYDDFDDAEKLDEIINKSVQFGLPTRFKKRELNAETNEQLSSYAKRMKTYSKSLLFRAQYLKNKRASITSFKPVYIKRTLISGTDLISLVPDGEVTDAIFKMLLENLKETEELEERIEVIDPTVATLMRHLPEYAEAEMKNLINNGKTLWMVPLNNSSFDDSAEGTHWSVLAVDFNARTISHFDSHGRHNNEVALMFAERVNQQSAFKLNFLQIPCVQQSSYGNNCALHSFVNIKRSIKNEDFMTPFDGTKFRFWVIDWMQTEIDKVKNEATVGKSDEKPSNNEIKPNEVFANFLLKHDLTVDDQLKDIVESKSTESIEKMIATFEDQRGNKLNHLNYLISTQDFEESAVTKEKTSVKRRLEEPLETSDPKKASFKDLTRI